MISQPIAFKLPRFYPIVDTAAVAARGCAPLVAAEALIEAGARILQYRHKSDWLQSHFDEAQHIATACHSAGVLFVLNDRADFACAIRAALHLGQTDLPVAAARRILSDEVVGLSTHNLPQLRRGDEERVEYLALGPIFETASKAQPDPVVGFERLHQWRTATSKPLAAIGGITLDNAPDVLEAGADAVVVLSGILPEQCDRANIRKRTEIGRAACRERG